MEGVVNKPPPPAIESINEAKKATTKTTKKAAETKTTAKKAFKKTISLESL